MLDLKHIGPGQRTTENNLIYAHVMIIRCMGQIYFILNLFTYNLVTMCKYDTQKFYYDMVERKMASYF